MNNLLTPKESRVSAQAAPRRTVTPWYDVKETSDAFILTAQVPGVDRASLDLTVDAHKLTVLGRRVFTAPAEWTTVHREIPQADYRLSLELDHRFNPEAVRAELSQGVLTLTLPKAEAVKPRRIDIKG
jgi:HSP20 family molecular chaperone IbpA